jgi:VWFA-related protein
MSTMAQKWGAMLWVVPCVAFGQQAPADGSPDTVFRATTKLVQVSVIAQDKKGQPVADLRREEFQIFDNGAPQPLHLFIAETSQPSPVSTAARPPNTFTNQVAAPAGSHSGYSVVLFDNLVTGFGNPDEDGTSEGRLRVLRMFHALPEDEKIALYAVGRKLQIVREFTTDRESLEQELRMWTPAVDTADLNYCAGGQTANADPLSPGPPSRPAEPVVQQARARAFAECDRIDMLRRLASFDEQLKQMADHLAGIPGRKNLIWMANRFRS